MSEKQIVLFRLDEMVNDTCKTISIPDGKFSKEIFAVFKDNEFFVYENSCPHTGAPLDWAENQFLNLDKEYIQCAIHGAQFRINDGFCVYGPCSGQSLTPVPVTVLDGEVLLLPGNDDS